jgi:hypothetical protein
MKFTKESIINSNSKIVNENLHDNEKKNSKSAVSLNTVPLEKKEINNSSSQSDSFISEYKYVILFVIISIVMIIIIYFIYKYFDNKNNQKTEDVPKEDIKLLDNKTNQKNEDVPKEDIKLLDKNVKDDNVKEYISNYIINEDEEEEVNKDEEKEVHKDEKKENIISPIIQNPIIQTPIIINKDLQLDSNICLENNIFVGELESENIDFLLNSLNEKDKDIYDISDLDDTDYIYESNGNKNDKVFSDISESSENGESSEFCEIDDSITIFNELENNDDDIKYFKKFTKNK